jgi:hypothetical protein
MTPVVNGRNSLPTVPPFILLRKIVVASLLDVVAPYSHVKVPCEGMKRESRENRLRSRRCKW